MATLPSSWKLKTRKRKRDGKLEVIGKDDTGKNYVARTCPTGELTDDDVAQLARGNRETTTAREFVKYFEGEKARHVKAWEDAALDDYMEAADQVVFAGFHIGEATVGFSRTYARNYDRWIESCKEPN